MIFIYFVRFDLLAVQPSLEHGNEHLLAVVYTLLACTIISVSLVITHYFNTYHDDS